ncbi:MAG: N-acetyltransferase family protein [Actinomycetota bacterium]
MFRMLPVAPDADDRFLASFDAALELGSQCFLIALEAGTPVGMAHCKEGRPSKMSDVLGIEMGRVVVAESHRGTGVGRALFNGAQEFARERGAAVIAARVWSTNEEALRFWRGLGFDPFVETLVRPVDAG